MFVFGVLGGIYYVYKGKKEGIVFSKKELLSNNPLLSPLQKIIAGIICIIVFNWVLFIDGDFYEYIDAVKVFLES